MDEKELVHNGFRKYSGENLSVYFNKSICEHSGVCVNSLPTVFNLKQKPWIKINAESAEKVMEVINECPSGALQYSLIMGRD